MSEPDEMGLTAEAAEGYERYFVPAIFSQWPPVMLAASELKAGDDFLDVGCGTGVLTREAAGVVGANGRAVGLDLSESMLGVARKQAPTARFQQGNATALPFEDASFDVVCGAFMLMFVPEPAAAVKEMWRVLRPGGRLVLSVWQALSDNPVYSRLVDIASRRIDRRAGEALSWPYQLGADGVLAKILEQGGARSATIELRQGRARFPSLEGLVTTEIKAWVIAESVDESAINAVIADAKIELADYCAADGSIDFPFNALVARAQN